MRVFRVVCLQCHCWSGWRAEYVWGGGAEDSYLCGMGTQHGRDGTGGEGMESDGVMGDR